MLDLCITVCIRTVVTSKVSQYLPTLIWPAVVCLSGLRSEVTLFLFDLAKEDF